jgi:PST family polysaccharide transporter
MVNSLETEHQIPGEPLDAGAEPTLREQVSSGVFWSGTARVVQQVIQFAISVVLARLLSPDDYGVMAMVLVFTGFAGMLTEFGFSTALVQKKSVTEAHISSAFWVTIVSGIALTCLTFALAPFLARFYGKPALTAIFQVVALNFVISSIGNVPMALLQKQMDFRTIGNTGTFGLLSSGVLGIAMASAGFGVWSLVAQTLVLSAVTTLARWYATGWFPRCLLDLPALREMWRFSANLFGFNFINYWARNADNLLIGKYFGAPALGTYNRAYALMLLPITQVNSVVSQVVFPALSSIQDDKRRVKSIYLRAIGVIGLIVFPVMMGLVATARPFVTVVYGPRWAEVAPLLQILGLVGICQALTNSTGWIYFSQGRTDRLFKWGVGAVPVLLISFVAGVYSGSVTKLALYYAIANVLLLFPALMIAGNLIDLKVGEVLKAVIGPLALSVAMGFCVLMMDRLIGIQVSGASRLLIDTVVGASVYLCLAFAFKPKALSETIAIFRGRLRLVSNPDC